jgi:hypothetical protein
LAFGLTVHGWLLLAWCTLAVRSAAFFELSLVGNNLLGTAVLNGIMLPNI